MGKQHNLEYKDGGDAPTLATKDQVAGIMGVITEYQKTNDARLDEIEKKGSVDPLIDDKLKRMDETLDSAERFNTNAKIIEATAEQVKTLETNFDRLETILSRKGMGKSGPQDFKSASNNWATAAILQLRNGANNMDPESAKVLSDVVNEFKALNISTDTQGGVLAPMDLIREITKGVTEISPVRSLARVRTTSMKSVSIPKRTGQFAAQWVSEQGAKSETTGLAYGMDEIPTHQVFSLIDISDEMLEDAVFNMAQEIQIESVEQFSLAEGTAFVTGNGVGKPEGFMVNGDIGETVSGNATQITGDGLIDLKFALKTAYTGNANFVLNRTSLGQVRKLVDANGQYLWMSGIAAGKPNTIDGDPYVEMPDMPSAGAGLYPVAYGDFRRGYTWVDRLQMSILRDPYTQAASGNVRNIFRKRVGGQVVLAEAIKKMKCST